MPSRFYRPFSLSSYAITMTIGPKEGARLEPVNWKTFIGAERVPDLYS